MYLQNRDNMLTEQIQCVYGTDTLFFFRIRYKESVKKRECGFGSEKKCIFRTETLYLQIKDGVSSAQIHGISGSKTVCLQIRYTVFLNQIQLASRSDTVYIRIRYSVSSNTIWCVSGSDTVSLQIRYSVYPD